MSDRRNTNKITSLTVGRARELVGRGRKLYLDGVELGCLGNPDPVGMKVYAPVGEETFDDIQTTEEAQAGADRREAA